jgi:predicted nucleic acid-binding protein
MVYTDCVIGEAIGVVARRLEEKGRSAQFVGFLDLIHEYAPSSAIAWIFEQVRRWYEPILEQVRSSQGRLNFNDALLILAAQEMGVSAIVSFDRDFDDVPGLIRLHRPEDIL